MTLSFNYSLLFKYFKKMLLGQRSSTGNLITRQFLRGSANRRTPSRTTPFPTRISKPTAASRRKYLTRTTTIKSLESQETITTPKPKFTRHKFVSRRPPFLRRTFKPKTSNTTTETNRNTTEKENDSIAIPLELTDVVVALKDIQNAPLPTEKSVVKGELIKIPSDDNLVHFKYSDVTFTTSQPRTTFRLRESSHKNKFVERTTTNSPQIYSNINKNGSFKQQTTHTVAYTSPFRSESYPTDLINRIQSLPPPSKPYLKDYERYQYHVGQSNILDQIPEHSKVLVHSNGSIECLDQGNFPHPISCKKFISCAKMENGKILGWEYTCPKNLSFDPIGGICNWSADLGCDER